MSDPKKRAIPDVVPSGPAEPIIVSEAFIDALRAAGASSSLIDAVAKRNELLKEPACAHCGRCVLAGPPCCPESATEQAAEYEAWQRQHNRERSMAKNAKTAARRAKKVDT